MDKKIARNFPEASQYCQNRATCWVMNGVPLSWLQLVGWLAGEERDNLRCVLEFLHSVKTCIVEPWQSIYIFVDSIFSFMYHYIFFTHRIYCTGRPIKKHQSHSSNYDIVVYSSHHGGVGKNPLTFFTVHWYYRIWVTVWMFGGSTYKNTQQPIVIL